MVLQLQMPTKEGKQMTDTITLTGLVATSPRHIVTQEGLPITSFRLVTSTEQESNWYTVTGFKSLAINMATSISKGDRILITGNLRVRDWDNGERAGTSVEIEATSVGHDLVYGTSIFERNTEIRVGD